jgi:TonB family protein
MSEGVADVNAKLLRITRLSRPQKGNRLIASAFALAILFTMTAPLAQAQAPSPQATPSAAPDPATQASPSAPTTPTVPLDETQAQANLIHHVAAVYPPLAKTAHISGTVLLHCIIAKDGTVQNLHYVSGPPLLMKSAMDAVRQWKYQPTVVNGKKVEVDTTVSVVFTLQGPPGAPVAAVPAQATASQLADRYKPSGYVNDFAGVIDPKDQARLSKICKDVDQKTQIQMSFVTVDTVEGQSMKDFAMNLGNLWGVGHKETNRGLLIVVAVQDRQWRISIGTGLESVMSDADADRLGREMVPMLKDQNYGKALLHVAKRIQAELPAKVQ